MSAMVAPISIQRESSLIRSLASGPAIVAPRRTFEEGSARSFTTPSDSPVVRARPVGIGVDLVESPGAGGEATVGASSDQACRGRDVDDGLVFVHAPSAGLRCRVDLDAELLEAAPNVPGVFRVSPREDLIQDLDV